MEKKVVEVSFKDGLIAGDVGPLGVRLVPFGHVQREEASEAFPEQIKAWAQGIYLMPDFNHFEIVVEIIDAIRD